MTYHHHQLTAQNIHYKHDHLFIKEISYVFWLKCKTIIRPITKTKRKILRLRGFEVSKRYTTLLHKFICNMYNIACINTCMYTYILAKICS